MFSPHHRAIATATGLAGFFCALGLVVFGDTSDLRHVWANEFAVVVLAGPSAWCAGLMCAGMMGHSGPLGWLGSAVGYVLATVIGAAIAGTLIVPMLGTFFAPSVLMVSLVFHPLVGLCWIAGFIALHKLAVAQRPERATGAVT